MNRYCLALDLKNNPQLISEYKDYHKKVWPEIIHSIKDAGIVNMEIYLIENRLFMVMETKDSFSFKKKDQMDANNQWVKDWEKIMWKYQQALPSSKPNEKWRLMERIFSL